MADTTDFVVADPPSVEARRDAARAAYLDSLVAGSPLTGKALGRMFDRSPRWGLDRIAEAKGAARHNGGTASSGTTAAVRAAHEPCTSERSGSAGTEIEAQGVSATRPSWKDVVIIVVVALVAGAASYGHMYEVALMGGESTWIARVFPITVDGLVLAALRRGDAGKWWLRLALAVSVAANVAAADPTPTGWAVAAWPPLALLGTHKLLQTSRPSAA